MLGVELGQPCPGARGLFISTSGNPGEPKTLLFLELDKSGDKQLFLVKFSTTTLKASQPWPFAD